MAPPNDDETIAALWRNELIKDLSRIRPDLSSLSTLVQEIKSSVEEGSKATLALHARLDKMREDITFARGALYALGIVGGLVWGATAWILNRAYTHQDQVDAFISDQRILNRGYDHGLQIPQEWTEMQEALRDMSDDIKSLHQAVSAKTPKVEIRPPNIIIQKGDQSRAAVPANPAGVADVVQPRIFRK